MNIASTTAAATSLISHPPVDWVILFILFLVITVDALRSGSARAATLAITMPLMLLFSDLLSRAAILGPVLGKAAAPSMQAVVFGILFATLFFLVYRIMYASASSVSQPFAAVIAGFAATIISLIVWLHVPALQSVWHFGPQIQAVFGAAYAFWWLIAGFLLMAFIRS